jgi:hypothetical protein
MLDLDGMTVMSDVDAPTVPGSGLAISLDLEPMEEMLEENAEKTQIDVPEWGDSPATASWGPLMAEVCITRPADQSRLITSTTRSLGLAGNAPRP